MLEKNEEQLTLVEGGLKAKFLKNLNVANNQNFLDINQEEKIRQNIISEIKEGKLK